MLRTIWGYFWRSAGRGLAGLPYYLRERAAAQIRVLYQYTENFDYRFAHNGEKRLMATAVSSLAAGGEPIEAVDGGANLGHWSRMLATMAAEMNLPLHVHLFEPNPGTFRMLQENGPWGDGFELVQAALSSQNGELSLYGSAGSGWASVMVNPLTGKDPGQVHRVRALRGDDYCRENGLERIHFLKLDLEGHEHEALKGFSAMLEAQQVDLVQFEYGRVNALHKVLLADLHGLLEGHGYRTGKIYPRYVRFGYDAYAWHEDFIGPNYVALAPHIWDRVKKDVRQGRFWVLG